MNKSALQPIEKRVLNHLEESFDTAQLHLVVGVSGGPDSMALLHILQKLDTSLSVVHINYEKRGPDSERDQRLVESTADKWGISCNAFRVGDEYSQKENFQQWARQIRYHYLRKVQRKNEAEAIALAHHEDDQIETILHKLFRGAGPGAWSGMSIFENGIFRPLLDTSKQEIMDYVHNGDIPSRIDQSNLDSVYARNFLRNEWIPRLDQWFPGWRQNILDLTEKSARFSEVVDTLISTARHSSTKLNRNKVLDWKMPVRETVILRWIKNAFPRVSVSGNALQELHKMDELQTGQSLQITEDVHLLRDRDSFMLINSQHEPAAKNTHTIYQNDLAGSKVRIKNWEFSIQPFEKPDFSENLYLDCNKLSWPLKLRNWESGDRLQPLGMQGTQKVKDHLTNRKISTALKSSSMVIEDHHNTIVTVLYPADQHTQQPGAIAEVVKCDTHTEKTLCITRTSYE